MTEVLMPVKCTLRLLLAEENVKRAREGRDTLSQQELARQTGLPPSVINGLVTGRSQRVDYKTIDRLCTYFNVQPGALFVWEPEASHGVQSPDEIPTT